MSYLLAKRPEIHANARKCAAAVPRVRKRLEASLHKLVQLSAVSDDEYPTVLDGAYYQHSTDKRQALREISQMSDPHAFLNKSGWYPGIPL